MSITHEEAARVRKYLWSHQQVPTVKIAVLGSNGVGKRSILQRLCYGCVIDGSRDSPTVELEWHKHVTIQGRDVHVQFDLIQGDACNMSEAELLEYVRPNEACFLVYDVTRRDSFDMLDKLREVYTKRRRIPRRQARSNTVFVIGNRIDRWRGDWTVSMHEADEFAHSFGAHFLQMSALTGKGTGDEVVVDMLGHILLNRVLDEAGPRYLTAPVLIEEDDRRSIYSEADVKDERISQIRRIFIKFRRQRSGNPSVISDGRASSLSFFATNNKRRKLQKSWQEVLKSQ